MQTFGCPTTLIPGALLVRKALGIYILTIGNGRRFIADCAMW
jgi:hypothetical protein